MSEVRVLTRCPVVNILHIVEPIKIANRAYEPQIANWMF
jgi:hypothetical protein